MLGDDIVRRLDEFTCGVSLEYHTEEFLRSVGAFSDVEKLFGSGTYEPMRLVSPISSEEDVLRPSLMATLLPCIERNLKKRNKDLRLFEIGSVFARKPGEKHPRAKSH